MCLNDNLSAIGVTFLDNGQFAKKGQFKDKPIGLPELASMVSGWTWEQLNPLYDHIIAHASDTFELLRGKDIHKVYMEECNEYGRGGSCMRGAGCKELRELYVANPERIGIVASKKNYWLESGLSAIVWYSVSGRVAYLDRVYTNGFSKLVSPIVAEILFHAISAERPTIERLKVIHNRLGLSLDRCPNISFYTTALKISGLKWHGDCMPYLDTLCYASEPDSDNKISLRTESDSECEVYCRSTDGTPIGDAELRGRYRCCNCDRRVNEDDMRSDDDGTVYCENCFDELYTYCDWSECYVSCDDIERISAYVSMRTARRYGLSRGLDGVAEFHISEYARRENFTTCADGCMAEYCEDSETLEDIDGNTISPADIESGDWVETYEGDYVRSENAHYWESDGEYHTEEEEEEEEEEDTDTDTDTDTDIPPNPDTLPSVLVDAKGYPWGMVRKCPNDKARWECIVISCETKIFDRESRGECIRLARVFHSLACRTIPEQWGEIVRANDIDSAHRVLNHRVSSAVRCELARCARG